MTVLLLSIIPIIKAVCTPKKILSPVIILVLIYALVIVFMVYIASDFN